LLCDILKGVVAVLVTAYIVSRNPSLADATFAPLAAALGAFLGHLFPVWLGFKGGKGVATYIGVLFGLFWPAGLIFCAIWLIVAFLSRYSSLAALVASALTPAVLYLMHQAHLALLFIMLSALLWIMHRANIARLLDGTETTIGAKHRQPPHPN
jgi:glycerol-3-phosphate acyltransferase PlsY